MWDRAFQKKVKLTDCLSLWSTDRTDSSLRHCQTDRQTEWLVITINKPVYHVLGGSGWPWTFGFTEISFFFQEYNHNVFLFRQYKRHFSVHVKTCHSIARARMSSSEYHHKNITLTVFSENIWVKKCQKINHGK